MPRRHRFTHVKNGERKKQATARVESMASYASIHHLHALIKDNALESGWADVTNPGVATIHLCKCTGISSHSYDLTINEDFTWDIYIHGCKLKRDTISAPSLLTNIEQVQNLMQRVEDAKVCPGNPDEKFVEMISNQKKPKDGELVACIIEGYPICCDGIEYNSTVRTTACTMLTNGSIRCASCNKFRAQLRAMYSRYGRKTEGTR